METYLHKGDTGSSPAKRHILYIKDSRNPRQVDEHYVVEKTSMSNQTHLSNYFNRRVSSSSGLFLKRQMSRQDLLFFLSKSDLLLLSENGMTRGVHSPGLLTS